MASPKEFKVKLNKWMRFLCVCVFVSWNLMKWPKEWSVTSFMKMASMVSFQFHCWHFSMIFFPLPLLFSFALCVFFPLKKIN